MNLRLIWQILRKDVEKSWWLIALTLALLARLAWFDSVRANSVPGSEEGWLNILLPVAWSLLIAFVLLEDSVEDDTPFWRTLPCRWPSVLAAKSLLATAFIHLPYLIACCFILQARQFTPAAYVPELLGRQCVLLVLTLSALALASLVRNVTRFLIAAIPIATAFAASSMGFGMAATQHVRDSLALSAVAVAGIVIAIDQYRFRRGWPARSLGACLILFAAVIWWLPREKFYGLEAATEDAPAGVGDLSVRRAAPVGVPQKWGLGDGFEQVAVPIAVTGSLGNYQMRLVQGSYTLRDGEGHSYTGHSNRNGSRWGQVVASLDAEAGLPLWQMLTVERKVMAEIGNSPVRFSGSLLAEYYRPARPVEIMPETNIPVADLGRCSSSMVAGRGFSTEMLHVNCESPGAIPVTGVVLTDPSGRQWSETLGSSSARADHPRGTWLSPIHRRGVFFESTDEEHYRMRGGQWMVPIEVLHSVRIYIRPQIPEGRKLFNYELPDIRLNDFLVKP